MKVVVDRAIPYIKGILEPYAEVVYLGDTEIDNSAIRECDALIIRTRTRCTRELLEGSSVKFIATATIGRDHIDEEYCRSKGIAVHSAPGCNARGVLQWVAAALCYTTRRDGHSPKDYTLGVVGVGNVGSLVAEYAEQWGFRVLKCDPPRQQREGGDYHTIDEVATEADIITLHTPLDQTTHHLINKKQLQVMKSNALIINASRGGVVDNDAVAESGHNYIFDVWENEPNIAKAILDGAMLSTPHIAGYSQQGKANATAMVVRAFVDHFDLPLKGWYPEEVTPTTPRLISWEELNATIARYCDIETETVRLKDHPTEFEALRNNYNYREEYF